jgi:hypothetical protein
MNSLRGTSSFNSSYSHNNKNTEILLVQEEPNDPLLTLSQQLELRESSRGTSPLTSYSSPTTRTLRIFKRNLTPTSYSSPTIRTLSIFKGNLTPHLLLSQTTRSLGFFN